MGEALQIRVSAVTWNEDLVEKLWPKLSQLAFSIPMNLQNHGVLEMVRALGDGLRFMDWSEQRKQAMGPGIQKAQALKKELERALADWNPRQAESVSCDLEACLDELERAFTKLKN
ncbi:MAG: hypothetical protein IK079_01700 [Desulfovibrio sp.]|nr:hypothetical protein [Desulfovibrio sp.]